MSAEKVKLLFKRYLHRNNKRVGFTQEDNKLFYKEQQANGLHAADAPVLSRDMLSQVLKGFNIYAKGDEVMVGHKDPEIVRALSQKLNTQDYKIGDDNAPKPVGAFYEDYGVCEEGIILKNNEIINLWMSAISKPISADDLSVKLNNPERENPENRYLADLLQKRQEQHTSLNARSF